MKTRYGIAAFAAAATVAVGWFSLRSNDNVRDQSSGYVDVPVGQAPAIQAASRLAAASQQGSASTAQKHAGSQSSSSKTVLQASWGNGPNQLGHRRPSEGESEGPMSFDVDDAGRVHVLDQVNGRIQVFENGAFVRSVSVGRESFQDMVLDGKGGWILLDRLVDAAVSFVSKDGSMRQVPLVGSGVPEGGAVTAMFNRDDGVWVEVEHAELVRVTDAKGEVDPIRPHAQGRFSSDGTVTTRAMLSGQHSVSVMSQPASLSIFSPATATNVSFAEQVAFLSALDSDKKGRTFVVADLVTGSDGVNRGRAAGGAEYLEAVVLNSSRQEVNRFTMPANSGTEEQFRSIRLGADGALYQLGCEDNGAIVRRFE